MPPSRLLSTIVFAPALTTFLATTLTHARPAFADAQELGWTAEGFIDPAAGEGQRVQIALDAAGAPTAVWASRATVTSPFRIVASTFDGAGWSAATPIFPAVAIDELLPQISRAPDGTLWLAWLRHDDSIGSPTYLLSTLVCARYVDGAWSAPEVVSTSLARPNRAMFGVEFTLLGVSRDSAWVAYLPTNPADPLTQNRDLDYRVRSAGGWSAPGPILHDTFAEWRPALARSRGGQPVAFVGLRDEATTLLALRWDGTGWTSEPGDTARSRAFYQWSAAPDTNGAIRLLVMQREGNDPYTDRIREYAWNDAGFAALDPIAELPVVSGQGADPPQWDGLSYAAGAPRNYRGFWVDNAQGSIPIVASAARGAGGFAIPELVGHAYAPDEAYPNGAYDAAVARWYAVWTAAPTSIAVRRAKFAWTQEFAGELGIGGHFIAPDTVRVTVACTGDGAGRTFHVYRLSWSNRDVEPPFPPPIPEEAVEIAGSPTSGPCPITIDDFPGPGRWYYYVLLDAQGTFPERATRSFTAIQIDDGGGGGGTAERTALRAPRPRPANGPVSLPFDLVSGGDVRLTVHDLFGRPRRAFSLGALAAGVYVGGAAPVWDGRDDAGRDVPSGVYFVRLWVDGGAVASERVVLMR